MEKTQLAVAVGHATGSDVTRVGTARGAKPVAIFTVVAAGMTAGAANAAIAVPPELTAIFTDLAVAFGVLMAAGAVLFGVIRGGIALFKIAGRVFSAAGA
jgi:hypothetical protein